MKVWDFWSVFFLIISLQDDEWGNIKLKNVSMSGSRQLHFLKNRQICVDFVLLLNVCREWLFWWWGQQKLCPRNRRSGPCLWRTWLRSSWPQRWGSMNIPHLYMFFKTAGWVILRMKRLRLVKMIVKRVFLFRWSCRVGWQTWATPATWTPRSSVCALFLSWKRPWEGL